MDGNKYLTLIKNAEKEKSAVGKRKNKLRLKSTTYANK